jgi:hypothetical protein
MLKKIGIRNLIFLLIFFLLGIYITFPLIFNLTSVTTGYADELFIAWNHSWNIHSLISNPLNIFNANIYFPYNNSLAYSEPFFTSSIIALLPVIILNSPIAANNILFILSLTLVGFFTYLISFHLTKNNLASFLAGVLIIFSPAYLSELAHIQIMSIFFVIIALILFIKYLQTNNKNFFYLFLITFILQVYNSFLPGFFILFSTFIIFIFSVRDDRKRLKLILSKKNILLILFSVLIIIPVMLPYLNVSKEFNYVRDVRETIHYAIQPEDLLTANSLSRLEPLLSKLSFTKDIQGNGEVKHGFIGLTFLLLILISFIYIFKNWKKQDFIIKGIISSSVFSLLMSFGPFMHINRLTIHDPFPIPLPYLIFYYIIPGFKGIRNSGRWEILFIVLAAPIVAVFLTKALKNVNHKVRYTLIILLVLVSVAELNLPINYYPVPEKKDFPKVYSYISTTPKSTVIVEMPVYNWNVFPYANQEFWREYYSTMHFRKTVNGASGFSPPPWQDTVNYLLTYFPSDESIKKLKQMGVNTIIVHKSEYDLLYKNNYKIQNKNTLNGEEVIFKLNNSKKVMLQKSFGNDYVFTILN